MIAGVMSYLDAAVLALALISGLLAMYRGFTRELLSIISWVVAGAAGAYVGYSQRELAQNLAKSWSLGDQLVVAVQGAIGVLVFLAVLLVVHLLTMRIADRVLDSHVGMIDRLLGFMFGVVRGLLVVGILFAGYDRFVAQGRVLVTEFSNPAGQSVQITWNWALKAAQVAFVRQTNAEPVELKCNDPKINLEEKGGGVFGLEAERTVFEHYGSLSKAFDGIGLFLVAGCEVD